MLQGKKKGAVSGSFEEIGTWHFDEREQESSFTFAVEIPECLQTNSYEKRKKLENRGAPTITRQLEPRHIIFGMLTLFGLKVRSI